MYVRVDGEKKLTFVVSGMLWNRSLVMQDLETKSLWSHLLGKSMEGPLEGTQLQSIPASLTDWETWRHKHPETSVVLMSRTPVRFNRAMYKDLEDFVLGMSAATESKAWNYEDLNTYPVVNDVFADQPVLVFFDQPSSTPFVYSRWLSDKELTFVQTEGDVFDEGTRSKWDLERGISTEGPLKDNQLKPLVGIPSFKRAWEIFYPDSVYWNPGLGDGLDSGDGD